MCTEFVESVFLLGKPHKFVLPYDMDFSLTCLL